MQAVVEAPAQTVHVAVGHAESESLQEHFAITVGVFEEYEFGGRCDNDAAVPRSNGSRKTQTFGEEHAAVDLSVVVRVQEEANRAARLSVRTEAVGIVAHLHDEHAPLCIEGQRDRIHNVRFGGEESHFQAGMQVDGFGRSDRVKASARGCVREEK